MSSWAQPGELQSRNGVGSASRSLRGRGLGAKTLALIEAGAEVFAQTVAASLQGRVALGSRAGQPLRRLRSAAAATSTGPRGARLEGFSLHADVAVPARRRDRLEHLVRSLVRPPLALARLTESTDGQRLSSF